jgi:hypothetical protein
MEFFPLVLLNSLGLELWKAESWMNLVVLLDSVKVHGKGFEEMARKGLRRGALVRKQVMIGKQSLV